MEGMPSNSSLNSKGNNFIHQRNKKTGCALLAKSATKSNKKKPSSAGFKFRMISRFSPLKTHIFWLVFLVAELPSQITGFFCKDGLAYQCPRVHSTESKVVSCRQIDSGAYSSLAVVAVKRKEVESPPNPTCIDSGRPHKDNYQWLSWMFNQWKEAKVGTLDSSLLKQMLPAMSLYAKQKKLRSAKQAESFLDRYVDEYLAGNPDASLSISHFNAAIDAYAQIGEPERAQLIMRRMLNLVQRHPKRLSHLEFDVVSWSSLCHAWARSKSPEAVTQAQNILKFMEQGTQMAPNVHTYNCVLNAIAQSTDYSKGRIAHSIVKRMERRAFEGHTNCKPCIYTYQTLIAAWSRTRAKGSPQKAESVLRYLDQQAAKGKKHLDPNAHCFAAVMRAWAYSKEKGKAQRAYQLLQEMRHRYEAEGKKKCKPNVVVFTAAINACSQPLGDDRWTAFEVAQIVLEELKYSNFGDANFLTYAAFFRACATTPEADTDSRATIIRNVFNECRDRGQVGQLVLRWLEEAATADLFEELVGGIKDAKRLPPSWTCKVKGERPLS